MLEYRENHVRRADGTLVAVEPRWVAEAEWSQGDVVVSVIGATADEAWAQLRRAARAAARPRAALPARTPSYPTQRMPARTGG
jgi:hypothetical protein